MDMVAMKLKDYLSTGNGMSELTSFIRANGASVTRSGYSSPTGNDIDPMTLTAIERQRFDALVTMLSMG